MEGVQPPEVFVTAVNLSEFSLNGVRYHQHQTGEALGRELPSPYQSISDILKPEIIDRGCRYYATSAARRNISERDPYNGSSHGEAAFPMLERTCTMDMTATKYVESHVDSQYLFSGFSQKKLLWNSDGCLHSGMQWTVSVKESRRPELGDDVRRHGLYATSVDPEPLQIVPTEGHQLHIKVFMTHGDLPNIHHYSGKTATNTSA
jgi:hypothetical protein